MRAVRQCFLAFLFFVFVCVAAMAQTPTAPQKTARIKKHPTVKAGQECSACHKNEYQQWEAGPHGVNQVKCFVCHGAIEEGFTPKPDVSRCESCHSSQVAQLKSDAFMKAKTCFTCHPPHSLKPHASTAKGGK